MEATWTDWFGNFATAAAAKRHLSTRYVGLKVHSRADWIDTDIRQVDDRWQVRLLQAPTPSLLDQLSTN